MSTKQINELDMAQVMDADDFFIVCRKGEDNSYRTLKTASGVIMKYMAEKIEGIIEEKTISLKFDDYSKTVTCPKSGQLTISEVYINNYYVPKATDTIFIGAYDDSGNLIVSYNILRSEGTKTKFPGGSDTYWILPDKTFACMPANGYVKVNVFCYVTSATALLLTHDVKLQLKDE